MTKASVLVLGATSAMARATAAELARDGHSLFLAGRDSDELERIANDLHVRYKVSVKTGIFQAEDLDSHDQFIQHAVNECGELDGVIVACGYLGEQSLAITQFKEAEKIIQSNFTGVCSLLSYAADYLEKRGKGFIIGVASVAGDRGRQSNYVYGAAKAGFTTYLQGLRNRLFHSGVHVLTVKPGFVDTAMTFGLPGMFLVASPTNVGKSIFKALKRKRNEVYVPGFWRGIMGIIKWVPEFIFKRLKL
jgi:decaprenylphospho-beta-D-erythro-pentofuranosid-2-ulose 2-reductase